MATETSRAVLRLSRRLRNLQDDALQNDALGLSMNQMSALFTLSHHESLTMGELAGQEHVRPPSMTRIVDGLVQAELARRVADPNDRRTQRVQITDPGRALLDQERAQRHRWLAGRIRQLSEEERATLHAAIGILERVNAP